MTGQEAVDLIHQEAWTGRKPGPSFVWEYGPRIEGAYRRN